MYVAEIVLIRVNVIVVMKVYCNVVGTDKNTEFNIKSETVTK